MAFEKELKNAEAELLRLEQQKLEIERQMRGWIHLIEGYRTLVDRVSLGDPPTREEFQIEQETPSLPSKILAVLSQAGQPIGATQIRDWLLANRAADPSAKNLLINIHTTLKRLMPDQVEEVLLEDGSKLYKYVTPMERALKAGIYVPRRATLDSSYFKPTPRVAKKS
ncbi:MAG: hypothetical protein WAL95_23155 [Candidatus Acidiferrales bacterium]